MNESRYAHCTYLQLVAELGIGVLPFLALLPLAGWTLVRRGAQGGAIGVAASVGALSFLAQNLVDFTFYQPAVGALFILACAIAARGPAPPEEGTSAREGAEVPSDQDPGRRAPAGRLWSPAHATVLAASLAAGIFLIRYGISDLSRERAAFAHEVGRAEEGSLLARAIRWDPYDPEPRGDLAALLASPARGAAPPSEALDEALAQARAASRLDPQAAFRRRDLARVELMKSHSAAAWIELARAASLYPMKEEYRRDLEELQERLFAPAPGGPNGPGGAAAPPGSSGTEGGR